MSHLVYITLYGETDVVILSRLDYTYTENNENKLIWRKRGLNLFAIFLRDGVEESIRNESFLVIFFHVNNQLYFSKEASKSNPLLL